MEITTENISLWLREPHNLPERQEVNASLKTWPWFMPVRLMEAAHHHRNSAFSPKTMAMLELYGADRICTHYLLTRSAERPAMEASAAPDRDINLRITPGISEENMNPIVASETEDTPLIQPLYTEDYFRHQGIEPAVEESLAPAEAPEKEDPRTLMVMMSFSEWLSHFKVKSQREQEEEREKSALRSMWQQEKLAAALGEETEEIPEDVFEMAVSSITREDDIVSEPLALILEKQEKWAAAAEMYKRLSLRNPAKSSYFASRAEAAKKRLQ